MRRAIVGGTATVSGIVLLLGLKAHSGGATSAATALPITSGQDPVATAPPTTSSSAPATSSTDPSAAPSTSAAAASGGTKVVTGAAAATRFGPVQVQVTFADKQITKVDVVEYPTESRRDQEINQYAIPVLVQESITAQSANIDAVSGATYTSEGYLQSLQSAIDQAGA